jgi:hypothetical protein
MKHIVSFSTGLSSAITAARVIARYGKDATTLVFMDTHFEDDDNYRFMADFERVHGVEILRLDEGRNPYEVSRDEHVIPNNSLAPCTFRLKIEPFRAWLAVQEKPLTIHIGYDWQEIHRCEPTRRNYEGLGYEVDFPLLWKPYEFRDYKQVSIEDWGIEPPQMYALGYTHANCGGRCCKQGQGDWLRTLINFPERFAEMEAWEADMRQNETNANYALLKTEGPRVDGKRTTTPKTLRQLREEYEVGKVASLFDLDGASGCVVCGIGG